MLLFVAGIDVGTQGARVIIVDLDGCVNSEASEAFPASTLVSKRPGIFEQDPRLWREAVYASLAGAMRSFRQNGGHPEQVAALAVTSTSGTLCLADVEGEPLGPAIMYSDARATAVADEVQAAGTAWADKLGSRITASFALSKLRWVQANDPGRLERARWFLSPADMVAGWLCGEQGHADWTSALKWGYDVVDLCWPGFIGEALGLPMDKMPRVQAPGSVIGPLSADAAARMGLTTETLVVAGATDGTASQIASGAVAVGDWNSTLGTTLVLKGVSEALLRDPLGRIYCHRHPDGYWLPGGASNTGADCLAQRFDRQQLETLNAAALGCSPTDLVLYPLARRGERFPFDRPDAEGFVLGDVTDVTTHYAAHLEGLAYVERLAYGVVESLGARVNDTVYAAGGGTQSRAGLQIRADVLGKRLAVAGAPSGAMGAAILAARGVAFPSVADAVKAMVRCTLTVDPRRELEKPYQQRYQRFLEACRERGYIE